MKSSNSLQMNPQPYQCSTYGVYHYHNLDHDDSPYLSFTLTFSISWFGFSRLNNLTTPAITGIK